MEYKKFNQHYVVRFDPGDEVIKALTTLAKKENIKLANVTGIGALNHAVLGVFDTVEKKFLGNTFDEPLEATAICGSITTMNQETYVHIHLTAGKVDGMAIGGHLQEAIISATGEVVVTVIDGEVDRVFDEMVGLNIFDFH